jgi:transcription antitermination factor NusG
MQQRLWYAICTAKNFEGKVAEKLKKKDYQYYCPHTNVEVKSASRKYTEWKPLFNGCLFINVNSQELKKVLGITGVVNTLFKGKDPAIITDKEIRILKQICLPNLNITLQKVPFHQLESPNVRVVTDTQTESNFISYKYRGLDVALPSLGFKLSVKLQGGTLPVFSEELLPADKYAA